MVSSLLPHVMHAHTHTHKYWKLQEKMLSYHRRTVFLLYSKKKKKQANKKKLWIKQNEKVRQIYIAEVLAFLG